MKIFSLIIGILMTFAVDTSAQKIFRFSPALDTVVNSATEYLTLTVAGSYKSAMFQIVCTEISGTTAGKIQLQYSVDGTNYDTLATLAPFYPADQATNSKIYQIPIISTAGLPVAPYYRFKWVGAGTMSNQIKAYAHFKP